MKNKIILVGGDPNSINSEIIFKSWKKLNINVKKNTYLIANFELIKSQRKKLKFKTKIVKVKNLNDKSLKNSLKIIDVPLNFKNSFNVDELQSSKYVLKCLALAHKFGEYKNTRGIINCPINKKLLKNSNKIGVTEYFASRSNVYDGSEVMMIYNKKLSVVPITTHIPIEKVSKKISSTLIVKKIVNLNHYFRKFLKKKPKIGMLGLNPHIGELDKDSEEINTIIPAIRKLKRKGINIQGPFSADTVFINNYKKYNVIVGMYHDQVLGPFKTLFQYDAINVTLGLNYLRVSPDHGPASNLIYKDQGNYQSLLQCFKFISKVG
jgi:4-hydroxythreonine-4-phosphate dehydrogenase